MGSSVGKFYNCDNSNIDTITNVNTIVNCVENNSLKDIISGSASPSLQFIFDFNNNTYYNNKRLEKGFMKLFVSNSLDMNKANSYENLIAKFNEIEATSREVIEMKDEIFAVNYEYHIYKYIIKPLIDYKISPHFVKFLGGILDTRFTNVTKFLSDKSGIDYIKVINNFKINLDYSLSGTGINKVKLGEVLRVPYKSILNPKLSDFEYGFILIEGINYNPDVKNLRLGESCNMDEYLHQWGKVSKNVVYKMLFQVVTALYALSLTKTIHNDLHLNNIYVTKTEPHVNDYIIDDSIYSLGINNSVVIYDFDRAYHVGYVNDMLEESFIKYHSQSNEFIEMKDLVKVVSGFYQYVDDTTKEQLLDLILKNKNKATDRDFWKTVFTTGTFLQKPGTYDMIPLKRSEYDTIDNYPAIIRKLYALMLNPSSLSAVPVETNIYYCNKNMFKPDGSIDIEYTYTNVKELKSNLNKEKRTVDELNDKISLLNDDYEDLEYTTNKLRTENRELKNLITKLEKEEGELIDSDSD